MCSRIHLYIEWYKQYNTAMVPRQGLGKSSAFILSGMYKTSDHREMAEQAENSLFLLVRRMLWW